VGAPLKSGGRQEVDGAHRSQHLASVSMATVVEEKMVHCRLGVAGLLYTRRWCLEYSALDRRSHSSAQP
jgi:hypothetical protein